MITMKRCPAALSIISLLTLTILVGPQIKVLPALAQSEITAVQVENPPKKPDKRRVLPANQEEQVVSGSLAGEYFHLKRALRKKNTIILEGGALDPSNAAKGKSSITIEFLSPQKFCGEIYQVRYHTREAKTRYGGQTKAPQITYVTVDKNGNPITTIATNSSGKDNQDYTMELEFFPLNKKGQLPGILHLQIGTNPISDLKGYFYAQ
jgi:hypothetical protein